MFGHMYSGARIIRTKIHEHFCANSAECTNCSYIDVTEEAYSCANNDSANYAGCVNKRGSNYPSYTVYMVCGHTCVCGGKDVSG